MTSRSSVSGFLSSFRFTVRAPTDGDPAVAEMADRLNRTLESTATALTGMLDVSAAGEMGKGFAVG